MKQKKGATKKITKIRKQNMSRWTEQDHAFYKEILDAIPDTEEEESWASFQKMIREKKAELTGKKKR